MTIGTTSRFYSPIQSWVSFREDHQENTWKMLEAGRLTTSCLVFYCTIEWPWSITDWHWSQFFFFCSSHAIFNGCKLLVSQVYWLVILDYIFFYGKCRESFGCTWEWKEEKWEGKFAFYSFFMIMFNYCYDVVIFLPSLFSCYRFIESLFGTSFFCSVLVSLLFP